MEEGDIEGTQQEQEPLFKLLSDSAQCEGAKAPNPKYEDGKVLPRKLRTRFLQEARPCVPLEEIDPYFRNKQTFVVIGRWGTIHRFSSNPDGYFTLGPNNVIRRLAIYMLTNWIFSTFLVAALLLNAEALMKTQNYEIMKQLDPSLKRSWVVDAMYVVNYICLAIYCFELALKLIARGFIGDAFTCFRDPWTWLDKVVIWTGFYPTTFILSAKSALWLRIFKIIPLIPSIRQACKLSGKAVYQLRGMVILGLLLLWFFSLIGLLYMGTLSQKCIKGFPEGTQVSDAMWEQLNNNASNWFVYDDGFMQCGNMSSSRACPDGYTCLQGFGPNPDFGQTNFDNIFWSLLSIMRISTDDFTEHIFAQLIAANGRWSGLLFPALFFLVTFPMGCLFFAILANFFSESKATKELEMEEVTALADVHDFDGGQNPESLVVKEKNIDAQEELLGFRKSLHSFIFHPGIRNLLIGIIILDIIRISSYHYGIFESTFEYRTVLVIIPYFVFLMYTVEFLLKLIALGPTKYFTNRWNQIDFIVLLTFFLEIPSYFGESYSGYMLAPFRFMKLIQYWPSLRMIFKIYQQTLKMLSGWILYGIIVFAFIVLIGPFELGIYEYEDYRGLTKVTAADLPRMSFIDFWRSFRVVVRMQIGEWVETFWDCYVKAGIYCVPYYILANLCGALLLSFLLVGIIYSTIKELQGGYDPSKDRGLRLLLRKSCGLICSPIKRIQPKELVKSHKNGSETAENGAEEQGTKTKSEGRRKKSIVAESTGQLRKVMQDCTEHIVYKIVVCTIITIASFAMIFEDKNAGEDLQTGLYVTEILFTVLFFVIAIYELLSYGFKESLTNRGWLFDALIVLEMILNLTIYKFSVTGPFLTGIFCIRSFRPLMLICRIDWIKAAFRGIKLEVKMIWETVLAILFIWLFFTTFGVHWLAGLYHQCIRPEDQAVLPMNKLVCLASNNSWTNGEFNFDSTATGFLNMVFLSSRMGWITIIEGASDAVGYDQPPQKGISKMWFYYFICFLLVGAFGALGILFAYIYNKFQEDNGYDIILTENQVEAYAEAKTSTEPRKTCIVLENDYVPPPESRCLLAFYNLVTNVKFDSLVMLLIIFDNILLSVEHYSMHPNLETVLAILRLSVLLLFTVEMIVKLISWGRHYFRSGWNWFDMIVVILEIIEVIAMDFGAKYIVSPAIIRLFRLLRIFRFLLAKKYGSDSAKILCSSLSNIRHAFANLFLLQLIVIWAFALLGNYTFSKVGHYAGTNEVVNFKTFSSSVWTLILLLGFPGLDGLYTSLGLEEDCNVVQESDTEVLPLCGSRASAAGFLGVYSAITFMVLLNMYSVLISEIVSEIARYKGVAKISDEEVPLRDVTIENGLVSAGDEGGEITELTEDPAENSEDGE